MRAPDPRFFDNLGPATLGELAALTGARVGGGGDPRRTIERVAVLSHADDACVAFFADRKLAGELACAGAGACFLSEADAALAPTACAPLITPLPQAAYAAAADRLHRARRWDAADVAGVHPSAELEEGVIVSPGAMVG